MSGLVIGLIIAILLVVIVGVVLAFSGPSSSGGSAVSSTAGSAVSSGPSYGHKYVIKFKGNSVWGIGANGTMSQTPGEYYFSSGKLLLASDPTKALGSIGAATNNGDFGLVDATSTDGFELIPLPGPSVFKLVGSNQVITRFGGTGLAEGAKLVTYEDVTPHYNQNWIVEQV